MKRKTLSLSVSILVVAVVGLVLFFRSSVVHGQTAGPPVLRSRPAEKDGQAVLKRILDRDAAPNIKLVEFRKNDGKLSGDDFYKMSYQATLECASDSGCRRGSDYWVERTLAKGERFTHSGTISFRKTENGWSGSLDSP